MAKPSLRVLNPRRGRHVAGRPSILQVVEPVRPSNKHPPNQNYNTPNGTFFNPPTSGFSFGANGNLTNPFQNQNSATQNNNTPSASFTFGTNTNASNSFQAQNGMSQNGNTTPSFNFGAQSQAPSFNNNNQSTPFNFGAGQNGASQNGNPTPSSVFNFNNQAQTSASPYSNTPSFNFGGQPSSASAFGNWAAGVSSSDNAPGDTRTPLQKYVEAVEAGGDGPNRVRVRKSNDFVATDSDGYASRDGDDQPDAVNDGMDISPQHRDRDMTMLKFRTQSLNNTSVQALGTPPQFNPSQFSSSATPAAVPSEAPKDIFANLKGIWATNHINMAGSESQPPMSFSASGGGNMFSRVTPADVTSQSPKDVFASAWSTNPNNMAGNESQPIFTTSTPAGGDMFSRITPADTSEPLGQITMTGTEDNVPASTPVPAAELFGRFIPAIGLDHTVNDSVLPSPLQQPDVSTPGETTETPIAVPDAINPVAATDTINPVAVPDTIDPAAVTETTNPVAVPDTTSPVAIPDTTSPVAVTDTTTPVAVPDTIITQEVSINAENNSMVTRRTQLNQALLSLLPNQDVGADWKNILRYTLEQYAEITGDYSILSFEKPSQKVTKNTIPPESFLPKPLLQSDVEQTRDSTESKKRKASDEPDTTSKRKKSNETIDYPKLPEDASKTANLFEKIASANTDTATPPRLNNSFTYFPHTRAPAGYSTPQAPTPSPLSAASGFKPTTAPVAGTAGGFLSAFGKKANAEEEKEKSKRKAEDFDSDEDNEEEWEQKYAKEQQEKKEKLKQPSGFKPAIAPVAGTPGNFLSAFGKKANAEEEKEKRKRKAEDFDSDEDNEEEWEQKYAKEQQEKKDKLEQEARRKKAKFSPTRGFVVEDEDAETASPTSDQSTALQSSMLANPKTPGGDRTWKENSPIKFSAAPTGPSIFTMVSSKPGITGVQFAPKSGAAAAASLKAAASFSGSTAPKVPSIFFSLNESRATPPAITADGDTSAAGSGSADPGSLLASTTPKVPSIFSSLNNSRATSPADGETSATGSGSAAPASHLASTTPKVPSIFSSLNNSRATSPAITTDGETSAAESGGEPSDEQNEPQQEQLTVLTMQELENEEVVFELAKGRAQKFIQEPKEALGEKKGWNTKCSGQPVRILKNKESGKARVFVRDVLGRVVINSQLLQGDDTYKVNATAKPDAKIHYVNCTFVDEGNHKPVSWLIAMSKKEDAEKMVQVLKENQPQ